MKHKEKNNQSILLKLAFAFFIIVNTVSAQTPNFAWANGFGSSTQDQSNDIAVDVNGNVYVSGVFTGSMDADPGTGVTNFISQGDSDIFIAKFSQTGLLIWAKQIGGTAKDIATSIAVDNNGNVFIVGYSLDDIDLDPGTGVHMATHVNASGSEMFYLKLDSNGNYVQSFNGGTSSGSNQPYVVETDDQNNFYVGAIGASIDIDPQVTVANLNPTENDIYIAKYDNNFNLLWFRQGIGAGSTDYIHCITVDKDYNVIIGGRFSQTMTFSQGASNNVLTGTGSSTDGFVWKLSANGDFIWVANAVRGAGSDIVYGLKTDDAKNIYLTGQFGTTADFNPGIDSLKLTSFGSSDMFISKLDESGSFIWANSTGSVSGEFGYDLDVDGLNNIYVTGQFGSTVDFNFSAGTYSLTASAADAYILKVDQNGIFKHASKIGGTGNERGLAIAVAENLDIYTTGYFASTNCDFDQTGNVFNIPTTGSSDCFIQKMVQCVPPNAPSNTTPATNLTVCHSSSTILGVNGTGTIGWYSSATGGVYLGGGNSFTTPILTGNLTYYAQDSTCYRSLTRTAITVSVRQPLLIGTVGNSTICGGVPLSISLLASNGTVPYNFSWQAVDNTDVLGESLTSQSSSLINNQLSNISSLTQTVNYNFMVTDSNNCTLNGNVVVSVLTAPTDVDVTPTTATCGNSDGSIAIGTVTNGSAPFTYSLDGGAFGASTNYNGLAAGTHTVVVMETNNCIYSETVLVNNASGPSDVVLSSDNTKCGNANGTVDIGAVTGGAGMFTFSLDGAAFGSTINYTGLTAGSHTVSVRDQNNCLYNETIAVLADAPPVLNVSIADDVNCFGGNDGFINLNVTGGTPVLQYVWTPPVSVNLNATGLFAGTYTCTVQDGDFCIDSIIVSINQPQLLTLNVNVSNATCGQNNGSANAIVSGGTFPYTYMWNSNPLVNTQSISGGAGSYSVEVEDANGCSESDAVVINTSNTPTPEICMVTVDSTSSNNVIYWNKMSYPMADSFYVYRDSANNDYGLIGVVPFDSLGQFVDTLRNLYGINQGNPITTSWRYKIAIRDTCGNMSSLSSYHQTMFLQSDASGNFNWTEYKIEGQPLPIPALNNYVFLRDNEADGIWDFTQTFSASSTLYTDPAYTLYENTANWLVETQWSIGCDPTMRLNGANQTQAVIAKSKSNIRTNRMIGISEIRNQKSEIKVYPNPSNSIINVEMLTKEEDAIVYLENLLGQVVYTSKVKENKHSIDVSNFENGVYIVKIKTNKQINQNKVIIQK